MGIAEREIPVAVEEIAKAENYNYYGDEARRVEITGLGGTILL